MVCELLGAAGRTNSKYPVQANTWKNDPDPLIEFGARIVEFERSWSVVFNPLQWVLDDAIRAIDSIVFRGVEFGPSMVVFLVHVRLTS